MIENCDAFRTFLRPGFLLLLSYFDKYQQ